MKLAIVGSRTFDDFSLLLDILHSHFFDGCSRMFLIDKIMSGGAPGADSLGERFADDYEIGKQIFKPDWNKYGKAAGFIRNQTIVDNCDMVLAFWDGESRGTADTIAKAKKAKKPTFIVYFDVPKPEIRTPIKGIENKKSEKTTKGL